MFAFFLVAVMMFYHPHDVKAQISAIPNPQTIANASDATNSSKCKEIPVINITSSSSQPGNPHTNAIDGNLTSRWSNKGLGSWIQLDLGETNDICSVNIAWYKGDVRSYRFVIAVSDGTGGYRNIFAGRSNGNTNDTETYNFTDIRARYVEITVNGNNAPKPSSTYAAIREIEVYIYPSIDNETAHTSSGPTPPPTKNMEEPFSLSDAIFFSYLIDMFGSQANYTQTSTPLTNTGVPSESNVLHNKSFPVMIDKNTTDFLIALNTTQTSYIRKTEILGIGAGNWAIVANGTVVKNNPLANTSSVSGIIVDFTAVQGDKTVYESFKKTDKHGGFFAVFTPPSAETTIITAKLVNENWPVQETISVGVTESLLPLILIAILLSVAILILIIYREEKTKSEEPTRPGESAKWTEKLKYRFSKLKWRISKWEISEFKWGIFFTAVPIIIAYMILARFPIYDVGGNSAIAAALITPIAGYLVELLKNRGG